MALLASVPAVEHEAESGSPESGALTPLAALQLALSRYRRSGSPQALDEGFSAAAAAVATVRGERAEQPADAAEARQLLAELPDFARFVSAAAAEAARSAHAGACRLWEWFGLQSVPPEWNEAERSGARLVVALACMPLADQSPGRLRSRLLRLAAHRWAGLLAEELRGADEELWRRVLGERYESVHRRYAPRTAWRTRELSKLLGSSQPTVDALRGQLERWLAGGRDLTELPAELEAAFVHTRTPARLA